VYTSNKDDHREKQGRRMTLEDKGASLRRTIIGTLAIILGIITCTVTLVTAVDAHLS
jgi:hypothetical protein